MSQQITSKNVGNLTKRASVKVTKGKGNTNQPVLDQNGTTYRKRWNGLKKG